MGGNRRSGVALKYEAARASEGLGVRSTATRAEIQATYKALAKPDHPDWVASLGPAFEVLAERRMQAIDVAA